MTKRVLLYGICLLLGSLLGTLATSACELPKPAELERTLATNTPEQVRRQFWPFAEMAMIDPVYRPVLRKALASDDRVLRRIAAVGLWATGQQDDAVLKTLVEALADRGRSYPLPDDLVVERGLTVQGLRALPVWRAALRHESQVAQGRALWAVSRLGPAAKEALPEVERLAEAPPDSLVNFTIFARWRLDGDDATAARQLAKLLSRPRERQCNGAVDRLADMGPAAREAIPTLIAVLFEHRDPAVLDALGKLLPHFPTQIQPALKRALDDPRLADGAAGALQHHEGSRDYLLPHLVRMMNQEGDLAIERHVLADILAEYGPKAAGAVPGLIRTLSSPSGQTRINAAQTLGEIGPAARDALPALREARQDPAVEPAASKAIQRIERK